MTQYDGGCAPILREKSFDSASEFTPESLLREARRQKALEEVPVPAICVLDPDGDIVRQLRATGRASRDPAWGCYHSDLYRFEHCLDARRPWHERSLEG